MNRVSTTLGRALFAVLALAVGGQLAALPWYRLLINDTNSIDGTLYLWEKNALPNKGELAVLKWKGGAGYAPNTLMFKWIKGVSGDDVQTEAQTVKINGVPVAEALSVSAKGTPMLLIQAQTIPSDFFFVANSVPNSFDSRYAAFGLVSKDAIVGRAHKVF
jgi:conjugal transfer pilin signal peptidase TrbI